MKHSNLFLLLYLPLTFCIEFLSFLGKTADPCNAALNYQVPALRDCLPASQVAAPSVTVQLPSITSIAAPPDPTQYTGTSSSVLDLTITASGLLFSYTTTYLSLASRLDLCADIDNTTVVPASTSALSGTLNFRHNLSWVTLDLELEDSPRKLCWSPDAANWQYTGFKVNVVWNCNEDFNETSCTSEARVELSSSWTQLSSLERLVRLQRTTCCKGTLGLAVGQCVNGNVQDCCGGTAYTLASEQCCLPAVGRVAGTNESCVCDVGTSYACPDEHSCCLRSKPPVPRDEVGTCYRGDTHECCDTGDVFDPGIFQCCAVGGVQSLDVPCACGADADCSSPSGGTENHLCCLQTAPALSPPAQCDTSTSANSTQEDCPGECFDPRFGICCNGQLCRKRFEACCNATCCNTHTSTCLRGIRAATEGVPGNALDFYAGGDVGLFDVCSAQEHLDSRRGFAVYTLPALLLTVSLLALAALGALLRHASHHPWGRLEQAMGALALAIMLLSLPLYFAPTYKYALVIFWSQLLVLVTAAFLLAWLNVVSLAMAVIALLYLIDPFYGNALLTFASTRLLEEPDIAVEASGILSFIANLYPDEAAAPCVEYYGWFGRDPLLLDTTRIDNAAVAAWGYCSAGWGIALMILSLSLITLCSIQLFFCLLGLLTRFTRTPVEIAVVTTTPD